MTKYLLGFYIIAGITLVSCNGSSTNQNQTTENIKPLASTDSLTDSLVYKTEDLSILKLSNHVYEHTSFLNTDDYGKVGCNGMIVVNENEAIIFDTPTDDKSSLELIEYLTKKLKCNIKAIIPTHFHKDCVGGLEAFNQCNIPIYASTKTIALLKTEGEKYSKAIKGFNDSLTLTIGDKKVYAKFFGEGHTKDNIVGYFPEDSAIFGGCLIKELDATKGYLGDANTGKWSESVTKLRQKYPSAKVVIPGHGQWGRTELFDYTIKLFKPDSC
ncbi:MAG: subclass B1 metallo-beta-lactamase [Bacteroidota bacterium]